MGRVYVIGRAHYLSSWALFWRAALAGILCFVVAVFTLLGLAKILGIRDVVVHAIVVLAAALGMPVWLFARVRIRIATTRRAAWCGVGFGTGLMLVPSLVLTFGVVNLALPGFVLRVLGEMLACSLAYGAVAYLAGLVCFGANTQVLVQGGTTCPGCGYSLIGNESMICPECGRGFTFEELETTEEEFRRQHQGKC